MANTLLENIKCALNKCDDVLLINHVFEKSLERKLFVQAKKYIGRFYLLELDKSTVIVRCKVRNVADSYFDFTLTRNQDNGHIRFKLTDHHGEDAFGAMGDEYYRKPIGQLIASIEDNTHDSYKSLN